MRYPETPAYGGSLFGCGFYGTMTFNICVANYSTPGKPVVSTETGYVSGTQSDQALGRYFPRILFGHLGQHVMSTYLYELVEDVNSPSYGIMQADFTPKPAYTSVQSLIKLFNDTSFNTPGKLQYTLSGQMTNVNHVLFQKTDGTYMLAIWLGVASANPVFPYETYNAAPQTITIATQTPVGSATVSALDDNGVLTTQAAYANLTSTPISVADQVTKGRPPPFAQNSKLRGSWRRGPLVGYGSDAAYRDREATANAGVYTPVRRLTTGLVNQLSSATSLVVCQQPVCLPLADRQDRRSRGHRRRPDTTIMPRPIDGH